MRFTRVYFVLLRYCSYTDVVPSAGETVMGAQFIMGYGGKGANQCVATQFLGSRSAIVSKVCLYYVVNHSADYFYAGWLRLLC